MWCYHFSDRTQGWNSGGGAIKMKSLRNNSDQKVGGFFVAKILPFKPANIVWILNGNTYKEIHVSDMGSLSPLWLEYHNEIINTDSAQVHGSLVVSPSLWGHGRSLIREVVTRKHETNRTELTSITGLQFSRSWGFFFYMAGLVINDVFQWLISLLLISYFF